MMTHQRIAFVLVGTFCLSLVSAGTSLAQSDPGRGLEEARALYRQGRFDEAIVELRRVVESLEQLRDMGEKRKDLSAAHFLLGLTYFAVRDQASTLENFRSAALFDPERTPDPEVFAPRVVELYEEARRDVLGAEAPPIETTTSPDSEESGGERIALGIGQRVRAALSETDRKVVGDIIHVDERTLTLLGEHQRTVELPRDLIRNLEISDGRRGHGWWGLAIGAGTGALIGALEKPADATCVGENCFTRAENITYGALGAGLIGGLVGALVKTDRWIEIPSERLGVRVTANRHGPGLAVTLSF